MLTNKSLFRISSLLIIACLAGMFLLCTTDKDQEISDAASDAYWPSFRGDQSLSGLAATRISDDLNLLWSFKTDLEIVSSPAVGFGKVFIGATDGKVYAVDIITGEKVWQFDTEDAIEASPLLLDETIYIGNLSGNFVALNALSGSVKWKYAMPSGIMGAANWLDDPESEKKLVLVGCYDTQMYCFDAENGELKWTYATNDYINGAPATDGKYVVFGGCDEKLHIVNGTDGVKTGEVSAQAYIAGSAAFIDGKAYLGHYYSKVLCIDVTEQKIVWEYADEENGGEFFSSPAVSDDRIVIGSRDYFVHCIDRESGKKVWQFQTRGEVDSSPVIAGNRVLFGSTDGRIYVLDMENGKQVWSYEIGASILGSPAVTGGMIFIGSDDGSLYAFGGYK